MAPVTQGWEGAAEAAEVVKLPGACRTVTVPLLLMLPVVAAAVRFPPTPGNVVVATALSSISEAFPAAPLVFTEMVPVAATARLRRVLRLISAPRW